MNKLKPLVAITGASAGIGEAAAQLFSENGYPLLLMARRVEKMQSLDLPNTICRRVDVTDTEELRAALDEGQKKFGPIDCLINNAGVMFLDQPWKQPLDEWEAMINVNVMGVLKGIHLVLDDMVKRKTGTIMNVSSLAGRKTFPKHAVYCASKFAVHSLSETIREEVSRFNVRVITIAPGPVETELITHTTIEDYRNGWWEGIRGILQPDDIARSILFAYEQPQDVCIREMMITPTDMTA